MKHLRFCWQNSHKSQVSMVKSTKHITIFCHGPSRFLAKSLFLSMTQRTCKTFPPVHNHLRWIRRQRLSMHQVILRVLRSRMPVFSHSLFVASSEMWNRISSYIYIYIKYLYLDTLISTLEITSQRKTKVSYHACFYT